MTLPFERANALENTREFLLELMDPAKTPRVPAQQRRRARELLKHYPAPHLIKTLLRSGGLEDRP